VAVYIGCPKKSARFKAHAIVWLAALKL